MGRWVEHCAENLELWYGMKGRFFGCGVLDSRARAWREVRGGANSVKRPQERQHASFFFWW